MLLETLIPTNLVLADVSWRPLYGVRWMWLITIAHFFVASLCFSRSKQERAWSNGRDSNFWFGLGLFMVALGVMKILDLQALLTLFLRDTAKEEGWYANRRTVQAIYVAAVGIMSMLVLAVSFFLLRGRGLQRGVAYAGAVFLLTLIVVRTASYHPIDDILYFIPGIGNRMNAGLELAGSIVVGLGARMSGRSRQ